MEQLQSKAYASIPPHALALFRILFGGMLIASWLPILLRSPTIVEQLLFGGMLIVGLLMMMGAWMRLSALILALVYSLQWMVLRLIETRITIIAGEGQALLFAVLLAALAISHADRGFSYAMFRRYGSIWEWEDVRARGQWLLKGIITTSYLYLGLFPLWHPVWMNMVRLRSALVGSLGTGLAARTARALSPQTILWLVSPLQAFTILLPFFLWFRSMRRFLLIPALLFHIVIGLFLGQWWLLVLLAGFPLFFDPEAVRHAWEKYSKQSSNETL